MVFAPLLALLVALLLSFSNFRGKAKLLGSYIGPDIGALLPGTGFRVGIDVGEMRHLEWLGGGLFEASCRELRRPLNHQIKCWVNWVSSRVGSEKTLNLPQSKG